MNIILKKLVRKDRRGISPLIATVLIIGFTVALAAVIITWGTGFVERTTEDVDLQTKIGITCTKVDFKIASVDCTVNSPQFDVRIVNNNDQKIANVILRATSEGGDVKVKQEALIDPLPLIGFGTGTANFNEPWSWKWNPTGSPPTYLTLIEAIPVINIENTFQPCNVAIEEFIPAPGEECGKT